MKKQIPALLAAIVMTALIALGMTVTGVNALLNKNGTDPTSVAAKPAITGADTSAAQIAQLQQRINEYAQREQQYQQIIQNNKQQVRQAAEETQQIQQLLFALQSRGLIQVQRDGTIMITGGSN